MGEYDIPAAIDLVLSETGSEKLYYIGHSMGTTMFWVALNEHPELKDKIALMIGMGPVAKVKNMKSPLRFIAPYVHEADVSKHVITVINENSHYNSMPHNNILTYFVSTFKVSVQIIGNQSICPLKRASTNFYQVSTCINHFL